LVVGRKDCVQTEILTRKQLAADNGQERSSRVAVEQEANVSEGVQVK